MFAYLKKLFGITPKEDHSTLAPYKVEVPYTVEPPAHKCTCGTNPGGSCSKVPAEVIPLLKPTPKKRVRKPQSPSK